MTLPHMSNTALHNGALAQTAPDPILTIDEASTILFVNAVAERVFGYSAEELLGQSLLILIPERLRSQHMEGIGHYVATGRRRVAWHGFQVPIRTKSGAELPVEISFGEFEWEGRRVFSGFLRDISARLASENAIAAATAQLQDQASELEQQVEEAQSLTEELALANDAAEGRAQIAARGADRARRLLTLSAGLNSTVGTSEVADLILEAGISAVGADAGTFAVISEIAGGGSQFDVIRGRGFSSDLAAEYKQFPVHPGRPMSDAVLQRTPVLVESREDALQRYPSVADVGYEAFTALPIIIGERAVAAIAFSFSAPQKFDEPTETFLRTVSELCAQALERARLYEDRDRQTERSTFLAEASRLLSSSLDYETTLKALAEFVVPTLADWCIVDIVNDPTLHEWPPRVARLVVVRRDPAGKAIASSLIDGISSNWNSRAGLGAALRTGTSQFIPVVTDETVVFGSQSEEHLAILRELCLSSAIVVPLATRGGTLGALTLLASDSGRRFDERDLSLATDLAARATTAIDNARLFRDAQYARTIAEEAMERADSASNAKSNFLATMSHEIRTPINAVLGYAELLEMEIAGPLSEEQRTQVGRIRASTAHLLTLVNEVLDLAKIESGTLRVESVEAIAGDTVNAALSLVNPQASAKGVAISERCEGECDARYLGDENRVRQVLANLTANAVKFTRPGGSVSVTCAVVNEAPGEAAFVAGGRYVAFRISDTGVGIHPDELENIFEAFVQAESKHRSPYTREQTGTGLGLAISRQLAHRMGGEITVRSEPGAGSTFTLYMPAA